MVLVLGRGRSYDGDGAVVAARARRAREALVRAAPARRRLARGCGFVVLYSCSIARHAVARALARWLARARRRRADRHLARTRHHRGARGRLSAAAHPRRRRGGRPDPRASAASGSRAGACSRCRPVGAGGALGAALLAPGRSRSGRSSTPSSSSTRRGGVVGASSTRTAVRWPADEIQTDDFYTAFPEGANKDDLGLAGRARAARSGRAAPAAGREARRRGGILAYSKICTHAGCAIAMYRAPLFQPTHRAGARLPLPLLDLRPRDGRHGDLRARGPAAAATADRCRRRRRPARRGRLLGAGRPLLVGRSPSLEAEASRPVRARPLPRRAQRHRAADAQDAPLRSSPTTGRSCSARSRSTRSSCSSRPAIYLALFFEPDPRTSSTTALRAATRPGDERGLRARSWTSPPR